MLAVSAAVQRLLVTTAAARSTASSASALRASADIVIVGGGIIGASIAYHVAARNTGSSIVVIERDPTYARAATTLSAASIRHQFSTPLNVAIGMHCTQFIRGIRHTLAVETDDDGPELNWTERGYLFLGTSRTTDTMRAVHEVQKAAGADNTLLSPAQVKARFPFLNVDDLALASFGLRGEGWIDPYAFLMGFKRKARALGVEFVAANATGLDLGPSTVERVHTDAGSIVPGVFINAAGGDAFRVAAWTGLDVPIRPHKRMVFVFRCDDAAMAAAPMIIDHSGVWCRPTGKGLYITGLSPPKTADPVAEGPTAFDVDHELFDERIWPALANRAPALENIKVTNAWAGHYNINAFDNNAVIGPHPRLHNFLFATGFAGHGLMQAPAAGRAVSELVVDGRFTSLDFTPYRFERIAEGRPILERAVI